jgi:hypothetical protein
MIPIAVLILSSIGASPAQPAPAVFGVFAGSSPCTESIRPVLQIPSGLDAHLIEWKLTLFKDPATGAPTDYQLDYRYGLTIPNRPGLGPAAQGRQLRGRWRIGRGTKERPDAVVYELDGSVSLLKVSDGVLHVLNGDRSLMVGTGGWSYTLNRGDASETRVDPLRANGGPDQSRTVSPVSTGPTVFGVFEGRTPCQGIAHELKIAAWDGCAKVKWRVTLYQDPATRKPTTYKVESSLHRSGREGSWTIQDFNGAVVYTLAPAGTEAPLSLLRGDANVLFFTDQNRRPLTAHAEFSYTLNRRK